MLLTITTTHRPATDLGFLLHKHPARLHSRPQTHGVAHVFFPEAGEALLRALFEPLGYTVEARLLPLDERFPGWGDSLYFSVVLRTTAVLAVALSHLYVLIPVLDNRKHYWIGEDEVHKLLGRGEPWLATHPQRDLIVQRYLKHRRQLTELAIERLIAAGEDAQDGDADAASGDGDEDVVRGDTREQGLERRLSLNEQRLCSVCAVVERLGASSVIDLGCGEGRLLKHLLPLR